MIKNTHNCQIPASRLLKTENATFDAACYTQILLEFGYLETFRKIQHVRQVDFSAPVQKR
jgi:hypothetical protein